MAGPVPQSVSANAGALMSYILPCNHDCQQQYAARMAGPVSQSVPQPSRSALLYMIAAARMARPVPASLVLWRQACRILSFAAKVAGPLSLEQHCSASTLPSQIFWYDCAGRQ